MTYQNIILLLGKNIKNEILNPKIKDKEIEQVNAENLRDINEIIDGEIEYEKEKYEEEQTNEYINVISKAFNEMYLKNKVNTIINYINIIILSVYIKEHDEEKEQIKEIYKKLKNQLELMQDKTKFLNETTEQKKEINNQIKKIDQILNDRDLLLKEYQDRNSKLKNEEKIFSISHLAKILEKEREKGLIDLRKKNKALEPSQYVREKQNLEYQVEFLKNVINNEDITEIVKQVQIEFLKCFMIQIQQSDSKTELLNLLYKFRYYCLLPINELQEVKDIPEIKDEITSIINALIDKSIDNKVIENISNSISLCYIALKNLFTSKILDLEQVYIKIVKNKEDIIEKENKEKEKLYYITISYYDSKEVEEEHAEKVNNLLLLNIKLNKKVQLFI